MGTDIAMKTVPETVPFPEGFPVIELPRISLRKILENDEVEVERIWSICKETGFFYLNLVDHPQGLKLWNDGVDVCKIGQAILPSLSMEEKLSYKARDRPGVFDMG